MKNTVQADGGLVGCGVLRGDSWLHDPDNARAAFRLRGDPDFRGYYVGFRVVRSAPIR